MKVHWTDTAQRHLDAIYHFIAQDSLYTTSRLIKSTCWPYFTARKISRDNCLLSIQKILSICMTVDDHTRDFAFALVTGIFSMCGFFQLCGYRAAGRLRWIRFSRGFILRNHNEIFDKVNDGEWNKHNRDAENQQQKAISTPLPFCYCLHF